MTTVDNRTAFEILRDARDWLLEPEHWHQGRFFTRGVDSVVTKSCALGATCLDLRTLLPVESVGEGYDKAVMFLQLATRCTSRSLYVAEWNDAPERTHAEVLDAFDRAITLAKEAEDKA